MRNEYTATIEDGGDGWLWAYCPEVPGANGQGGSVEEVKEDLAAAIELVLDLMREDGLKSASPAARRDTVLAG